MTPVQRALLWLATALTLSVIGLGAYVRLSDAGLGCPDWPGCYGHWLGVPESVEEQIHAQQRFPAQPIETDKAWKEMTHRYLAGTLGLLIAALFALAWRPGARRLQPPIVPSLLLGLVGVQAVLGMLTVTQLLKPLIVTLHLLGGMSILALLVQQLSRTAAPPTTPPAPPPLTVATLVVIGLVLLQLALGGWVSSNYAALACGGFPHCHGAWYPTMDWTGGFTLHRELGMTSDGRLLSHEALIAIHWTHRIGALLVSIGVSGLAWQLYRTGHAAWQRLGSGLLAALAVQLALGISAVLLDRLLPVAVAHTLGGAALLGTLVHVWARLTLSAAIRPAPPPAAVRMSGITDAPARIAR